AAFFAARALRRPQAWPSAALVGLAAAAASIVRPQAAATLAAFAVAVMVVMARRQLAPRRGAVLLLAAGVAFAAAWSVVLLALARAGALAHFLDLPIGFNGFMARAFPFTNRVAGMLAVANYLAVLLPLGVFGAWTASRVARVAPGARDAGFAAFALSWALVEVAGVLGIGRVVWHYLLEGIPAFCVLAGYALAAAPRVETPTRRMRIAAAVLVFQLAAGYVLYVARPAALVSEYPSLAPLVRFVREHTSPGDRIFVAGTPFGEAVHYYADRPPATRYLYFENAVSAYTRGRYLSEIEETLARRPPALLVTDARDDWYDSTLGRRRPVSSMIEARYPLVARIETPSATWLVFRPGAVAR
ncbi:MAG TPA: hypothetical protein VEA38_11210, partial [Terriglobales bacterium]|nr:hypothetical protein [Terriglobales bacterium]